MGNFFAKIYDFFFHHKMLMWSILLLVIILLCLSFFKLRYKEDISDFLPDSAENKEINYIYQHIGSTNKILVYFEGNDTLRDHREEIMESIDTFVDKLKKEDRTHLIPSIISSMDDESMLRLTNFLQKNAPYFLTASDYMRMDSLRNEEGIRRQLEGDKQLLMLPMGSVMVENILNDPVHLFSPLLGQLRDFKVSSQYELESNHIFTDGGRKGIVILTTPYSVSNTKLNAELLHRIDKVIAQTKHECTTVRIHTFGSPVIAVTNAERIKYDSFFSIILSLILIFSILIYEIRSARNLLLMATSILFGYLFALGLIATVHRSISIIVLGMSAVFIGIAINYALHYLLHLRHRPDARGALKEIASPLTIGNITTVGAFLSLIFIHSSAMSDLGLFASLMLLGTILFVLIFLPQLVTIPRHTVIEHTSFVDRLTAFSLERKWYVLLPVLLLTVVFSYFSLFTSFDSNMQNINYMTPEQKADMKVLMQSVNQTHREIVYVVNKGEDDEAALRQYESRLPLLEKLQKKGYIADRKGIGPFYPSRQEQVNRLRVWHKYWSQHGDEFITRLNRVAAREGFKKEAIEPMAQMLKEKYVPQASQYFSSVAQLAEGNYLIREKGATRIITLLYCSRHNIDFLEKQLKSAGSGVLVFDSRDLVQKMVDYLSTDFNYVLYVSSFIVFLFLIISFGRIELSLLSFLPLAVSWIWILGIMQICGMQFNIVNIILATFIFGQGDDYTIFITEGLMYEYTYRRKMLTSYKRSVFLSAVIMFIGIGSLVFAKHPAMRSLADIAIIGMFSVVMMAYIFPPLIFNWLTKKRGCYREDPITLKRLTYSAYAFMVFLIGTAFITLLGHLLFDFRKSTERRKLLYHRALMHAARFVISRIPGVEYSFRNLSGETFNKPSIIISNHQSHIDLMCLLMLTPKTIILTNDWAWNNIFYGRLVKYADFYPVSNGIENHLPLLRAKVEQGYSIVVFPEGTRSTDCSILRFHRGAFYLAQQLGLDIVPLFIHGNGHVLPKNDFMLREGKIQAEVHHRITLDDSRFAPDYSVRSREVRHYYQKKYAEICAQIEKAVYFKYLTVHNYLYKGPVIERTVRRSLKQHHCFADLIDGYNGKGSVLIIHCRMGEAALLFAYAHPESIVTAYEGDEELFDIASHCNHIPRNLIFTSVLPEKKFDTTINL